MTKQWNPCIIRVVNLKVDFREKKCALYTGKYVVQVDGRKNEETTWSVTNSRIVIDFYKDNAVVYAKSHKDYGNKVVTKKVFAPLLAKMPDKTITDIKKRWHTLRSSLLRHMKKPEEEVKWLYWKDMAFLRRYIESASSENRDAEWSSKQTGTN